MKVVYTYSDVRYWSEVLCCTIPTHTSGLEVKVTDLEKKICLSFWLKFLEAKVQSQASYAVLQQLLLYEMHLGSKMHYLYRNNAGGDLSSNINASYSVLVKFSRLAVALLMSSHSTGFYGELEKIFLKLSSNTPP